MPPRASAASWRTMSDSLTFCKTCKSDGTECGDRSCPNTNAISCLREVINVQHTNEYRCEYLNKALSSENPAASASTAAGVPILRSANIARYLSNKGNFASSNFERKSKTLLSDAAFGLDVRDSRPEDAGAGSIE